jgi:hypothetical protein
MFHALRRVLSLCLVACAASPMNDAVAAEKPAKAKPRAVTTEDLKGLKWRGIGPANMGGRSARSRSRQATARSLCRLAPAVCGRRRTGTTFAGVRQDRTPFDQRARSGERTRGLAG